MVRGRLLEDGPFDPGIWLWYRDAIPLCSCSGAQGSLTRRESSLLAYLDLCTGAVRVVRSLALVGGGRRTIPTELVSDRETWAGRDCMATREHMLIRLRLGPGGASSCNAKLLLFRGLGELTSKFELDWA